MPLVSQRLTGWFCLLGAGLAFSIAGLSVLAGETPQAGLLRTQTISLQRGWNAVFLEVYPVDPDPSVVFAGLPVVIAASYFTPGSPAQFVTDPGAGMFKKAGWGVWYAENRPDAFLKDLHAIHGQQGYLIHVTSDFNWRVTGYVTTAETRWAPDAFNLVGFGVHGTAAPTFSQFFAGSPAHRHNKIYRLVNGTWRRVADPSAENLRSGEAFWIYCQGPSTYQGPLRVETSTRYGLVLNSAPDQVVLRNEVNHPVAPRVEHVVSSGSLMPLSLVVQVVREGSAAIETASTPLGEGGWTQSLPPLEAGHAIRIPLELRLSGSAPFEGRSLLKITTDLGTEVWVPVLGLRNEGQGN